MSDYIVFTNNSIELHSKQSVVSIDWSEVIEIREVILGRGMREIKITSRDGIQISFASSGGREKQIWKAHPELKNKYRARCIR